jgi:hypothetical protein
MFSALVGTVLGGVVLYYLPGVASKIARALGEFGGKAADHLDKEFPEGTVKFGNKPNKE